MKFKIGDTAYHYRYDTELRIGYIKKIIDNHKIYCNFQSFYKFPNISAIKKDGETTWCDAENLKLFKPKNYNKRIMEV